jgi:hypothetical protein
MQPVRRLTVVAVASALGLLGVVASVAPAEARVISNEPFHQVFSVVDDQICPGLTLRIDFDIEGRRIVNTHGRDRLVYFIRTEHGTVSFTNLANDETVIQKRRTIFHDLKVTDNGDGTVTVVQADTGITGSTGKLGAKRTGTLRFEFVYNASGTSTDRSDEDIVREAVVKENTGQSDLPEGMCDLLR